MPLYEYQCDACGNVFERIQKFSDPPIDACPNCGGSVKKLPSSPAIQFKGTGWYITDYARKGSTDSGKRSEKGEAAAGASGTADKTTKESTASDTKSTPAKDSGKTSSSSST